MKVPERIASRVQGLAPEIAFLIGVDGGGSRTRARLLTRDHQVLAEGSAGASALGQGIEQAWRHVELALFRAHALARADQPDLPALSHSNCALGLGLSGANNADWLAQFVAANPGYVHLCVDSDAFTALLGAHQGQPGVLMIAGTGSFGQALYADGRRAAVGGWGFPSGDEASGAALGLAATALTQQAVDGRREHSALTQAVLDQVGHTQAALLAWCGHAGQFEFATLAPLVFETAAQDQAAAGLLQQAAQALELHVQALDPVGNLPLAFWGSIAQRLLPRLTPPTSQRVIVPRGDAIDGAVTLCYIQRILS